MHTVIHTANDHDLVEHFSGVCHKCGHYVDGRRHNAAWNPILGISHLDCPTQPS